MKLVCEPMRRYRSAILCGFFLVATIIASDTARAQNLYYFYSARIRMPECRAAIAQHPGNDAFAHGQCAAIIGELILTARTFCAPKGATTGQAMRIVVRYIDARPARLDESFVQLAHDALRQAWPCRR